MNEKTRIPNKLLPIKLDIFHRQSALEFASPRSWNITAVVLIILQRRYSDEL